VQAKFSIKKLTMQKRAIVAAFKSRSLTRRQRTINRGAGLNDEYAAAAARKHYIRREHPFLP